jgi:YVTN family beta-propeller protein
MIALMVAAAACVPCIAVAETLYVSNERGDSVSVIDGATMKPVAIWKIGARPRGIALSRDGRFLFVCVGNDHAVQMIDRATGKVVADLPSGEDPEQLFLRATGNCSSWGMRTMRR